MDIEARRKKQQALIKRMVERKVRSRAQELYHSRGEVAGNDLQDWFQAESELLENPGIASLYRRLLRKEMKEEHESSGSDEASCEVSA